MEDPLDHLAGVGHTLPEEAEQRDETRERHDGHQSGDEHAPQATVVARVVGRGARSRCCGPLRRLVQVVCVTVMRRGLLIRVGGASVQVHSRLFGDGH